MSIHFWTKAGGILITKTTRYVLPAIIAGIGAVGGYIFGYKKKINEQKTKGGKE